MKYSSLGFDRNSLRARLKSLPTWLFRSRLSLGEWNPISFRWLLLWERDKLSRGPTVHLKLFDLRGVNPDLSSFSNNNI